LVLKLFQSVKKLERNSSYTIILVFLAIYSAIYSIYGYTNDSYGLLKNIDFCIFIIFLLDILIKLILLFSLKLIKTKNKFSHAVSPTLFIIDIIALLPDIAEIMFSLAMPNMKALRVLRSLKLLRLLRVFTKNKSLQRSLKNLLRYKLYGASLILVINISASICILALFSFLNYEYLAMNDGVVSFSNSLSWAYNCFTQPFKTLTAVNGTFPKIMSFVLSCFGIILFAGIVAIANGAYRNLFVILDKGEFMERLETGDFLIFGWNHMIPTLCEHIINGHNAKVTVIANYNKELTIKEAMSKKKLNNIFNHSSFKYIKADYSRIDTLEKLNIYKAQKIVIVHDEHLEINKNENEFNNNRDAKILFTLNATNHAIKNAIKYKLIKKSPKIICEIFNNSNSYLFESFSDVEILSKENLLANLFSQSIIQDNLLTIYQKLLAIDDKEIYLIPFLKEENNITNYYDYLLKFAKKGVGLIGISFNGKNDRDSETFLSPSKDIINEIIIRFPIDQYTPSLIVIAEDLSVISALKNEFFL
jgi:hypothetical protein